MFASCITKKGLPKFLVKLEIPEANKSFLFFVLIISAAYLVLHLVNLNKVYSDF